MHWILIHLKVKISLLLKFPPIQRHIYSIYMRGEF